MKLSAILLGQSKKVGSDSTVRGIDKTVSDPHAGLQSPSHPHTRKRTECRRSFPHRHPTRTVGGAQDRESRCHPAWFLVEGHRAETFLGVDGFGQPGSPSFLGFSPIEIAVSDENGHRSPSVDRGTVPPTRLGTLHQHVVGGAIFALQESDQGNLPVQPLGL